ncbi:Exonuclease V [Hypsizygus marmoreus]|uniref:Exonuclease V n=1 Tax=Hypsizygus marmoreus TaxID=39966 RepID=A0A369K173_HYPMA|nr:Exonuclease V [Hypsizygus marmoreus]
MSDNSDDYAAFDFSEFTEDDFKQIDADLAQERGGPSVTIEVEQPDRSEVPAIATRYEKQRQSELSPLERFRPHGVLFVTDLASLAWCEVQFDYGLRQRRSKSITTRPKSFVSAQGKEITVDKAVALRNDETTKQGKAIHKALEREIRLEDLEVDITSEEELWGLRLVNMLASLRCIILEGFTREMPVLGIMHGQVIVGIIDEVVRRPQQHAKRPAGQTHSTPKSKRSKRTPSPSQPLITEFIPEMSEDVSSACNLGSVSLAQQASTSGDITPSRSLRSSYKHTLQLIDTKTRRTNSLPSYDDTLASRIQLMLYHRLLEELISTSKPYDFTPIWARLELNSSRRFSTKFLIQSGLITENDSRTTSCLDDLSKAWIEMVHELDVPGVDNVLQLIYRLQPQTSNWKRKNKGKTRAQPRSSHLNLVVSQEELDLARAIEASLKDRFPDAIQTDTPESRENTEGETNNSIPIAAQYGPVVAEGSALQRRIVEGALDGTDFGATTPLVNEQLVEESENITVDAMTIIGTKEFNYDEVLLQDHVNHVLKWWRGDREPQGVSLAQSRRCFSCEYEANCEWREKKAMEIRKGGQDRQQP